MSTTSMQMLLDKDALNELIYKQAIAIDMQDYEGYRNCFTENVELDFSAHFEKVFGDALRKPGQKLGVYSTRDQWVEDLKAFMPGFDRVMHTVASAVHKIRGDTAKSQSYVLAEHFIDEEGGERFLSGGATYYFDSVRTNEGWKIKSYRLKVFFYRGDPSLYTRALAKAREAKARETKRS
jgi:SnoaL-like domain